MTIRKFAHGDGRELRRLARQLFGSDQDFDPWNEQIFVVDRGNGLLGGYLAVTRRSWSNGSDAQPVAHIKAWFVDPDLRRQGLGTKLMKAAEHWAGLMGLVELCSDVELHNQLSLAVHQRMGFEPTVQLQYFRKPLAQAAKRVAGQG
jgi:aminoglycoside 6'-N-acetyltransferase I